MTNTQTAQIDKAAAVLYSVAGVINADTKLCEGVINLAADMFNIMDVEELDEDQLDEILEAIHECEQHRAEMRELEN